MTGVCARPGCGNPLPAAALTGRPSRYLGYLRERRATVPRAAFDWPIYLFAMAARMRALGLVADAPESEA